MFRQPRAGVAVALALTLVATGCLGFVTGEEALKYEAEAATVPDDDLGAFSLVQERELVERQNRTYPVSPEPGQANVTREIVVESSVVWYGKNETINGKQRQIASLAVVSTPVIDVVEYPVNPVGNMSERQLLSFLEAQADSEQFGGITELERVDPDDVAVETEDVDVLDTETDVQVYEATRVVQNREVKVRIYVAKVRHGDDYVVFLGGHSMLHPGEGHAIVSMMEAVEHDAD
jgi:hypothetical protein